LLVTASAVSAAGSSSSQSPAAAVAAPSQTVQTMLIGDSLLTNLTGNCGADAVQPNTVGTPDATPMAFQQTCGACSTSNCQGALRGQICYLGGSQVWGNCNIYSGGYRCSTGGWECQCGTGPLP